ncbi:MAG: DNA repair exonuclease [Chloroflexi bacterium]|nr:DNA repair exonuclease [Chloroflexota bacterium]
MGLYCLKTAVIKLLHTADIHLGAKFKGLGEKGKVQRQQVCTTFKKLIALAIEEKVDIVLIAGDLFDSNQQPKSNIDLVIEQFGLLASKNIPICIIPGTHDCFDSTSIYRKVNLAEACPNVTLFTAGEWSCQDFPALGLTVYGRPNSSNRSQQSPLERLKRTTSSQYHVALAHGSLNIGTVQEDDHVFTTEQLQNSQMNYIALGHWHSVSMCSDKGVVAWYSGAPEMIDRDQKQPGHVLLVSITDSGEVKVEPRRTGLRYRDEPEIHLDDVESVPQLKAKIMENANPNLVRRVFIKGMRGEDLHISPEELEDELSAGFFDLRIENQSHPKISQFSGDVFEKQLIASKFASLMREHIEACQGEDREIAEEALQYGIALLQGKEVL